MSKLTIIQDRLNDLKLTKDIDINLKSIVSELLDYVITLESECISLLQERNNEEKKVQANISWSNLRTDRLPLKINLLSEQR